MKFSSGIKQPLAIFMLLLTSIRILVVPVVYLDFELNKAYIIQNLCENRFKPELHCDGKCYLAKQLNKVAEDKAQKETERQEQSFKKLLEENFHTSNFEFIVNTAYFIEKEKSVFIYLQSVYSAPQKQTEHPPTLS